MKKIVAKTGEYEKDGQTKGRYTNIGVILSNDNGEYVLLDPKVNLAGVFMEQRISNPGKKGDRLICSIFNDDDQQAKPSNVKAAQAEPDFDDDFPF